MQVIPVIDLKDGLVVHARQGRRDSYLPIHTALCLSADIFDVIDAYLNLYDFQTFYIADLNSLEQKGEHQNLINAAAERFPERTFWLDSGFPPPPSHNNTLKNIKTVLGSESFRDDTVNLLESCAKDFILSLDSVGTKRLGADSLFTTPGYWPNDIIIMTLERVGSDSGPDLERLAAFYGNYPDKNFIAAGGIRNLEDLLALKKVGIAQALIASALHSGAIGRAELAAL
ncbi:HisA/HisF-related TIM barrel protein [Methylomicrobium sp. Wu6]|uniref:HisA/HisF-related TIM barrel protein n=1 Tax=Methylomicrobium sp. Wu6 TaxID=3107928 RepID=UPI002DD63449|nr:HisA/HisF-related TIM barrel protein [Methylomicrobium sp. Wu6]MEC4748978.1 HisA/HisF-related TIM barrel protein [Methylomicrobium sp. Wu6]